MLKHCATEVVEATEDYIKAQWQLNKNETEIEMEYFSSELADIICCCLVIAGGGNIDIEDYFKPSSTEKAQYQKSEIQTFGNIDIENAIKRLDEGDNLVPVSGMGTKEYIIEYFIFLV